MGTIKPGTDNYLAMSVINELISKKLYMPQTIGIYRPAFLVRMDNKKLLRRSDFEHAKDEKRHPQI